jgi:opacity protein-like surface antigen
MTKFALLGATLLATALASPALAQAVVEDPGYCAQFYPNANCQNYGPGNPLYPGRGWYGGYARMHVGHHRHHHHRHWR